MAKKPAHQPWHPFPYEPFDVYALQALSRGTANEGQQKRAVEWIIRNAGTYAPTFFVGQHDASDFAQGSRHVGLQIVKLINMPADLITKGQSNA